MHYPQFSNICFISLHKGNALEQEDRSSRLANSRHATSILPIRCFLYADVFAASEDTPLIFGLIKRYPVLAPLQIFPEYSFGKVRSLFHNFVYFFVNHLFHRNRSIELSIFRFASFIASSGPLSRFLLLLHPFTPS